MPKAKRVHAGIAYCETCYAREFVRMPCKQCGNPVRLHVSEDSGLCRSCSRQQRTCLRCGRPTPRAALIVRDKPVCPSCRRYFRPGVKRKPSNHATCRVCRKYRKVAARDENNRPICPACQGRDRSAEVAEKEAAYWHDVVGKRANLAESAIAQLWLVELWRQFVAIQLQRMEHKRLALRLLRYAEVFQTLDRSLTMRENCSAEAVGALFSTEEQRRQRTVFNFLREAGFDLPSAAARAAASEEARIHSALLQGRTSGHRAVLHAFEQHLRQRDHNGKMIALATVRLSLRTAADIVLEAGEADLAQVHVARYLRRHPGQRAALSAFVGFLQSQGRRLKLPRAGKPGQAASRSIPPDLNGHLNEALESDRVAAAASALIACLIFGFGMTMRRLLQLDRAAMQRAETGFNLSLDTAEVLLSAGFGDRVERYLRTRDAQLGPGGYLFPGIGRDSPLSESAVSYYLARWDTSASALRASAVLALNEVLAERAH